jgi:hypothetical protein
MSFFALASAATGLFLAPFGNPQDLTRLSNPWHGFLPRDPVLWVVRIQDVPAGNCNQWLQAIASAAPGERLELGDTRSIQLEKSWGPWDEDDINAIKDCDDFPCAVKLNSVEASKLSSSSVEGRQKKYFSVVGERVAQYLRTQERKEYEFSGNPVDPWALLEKHGFVSKSTKPPQPLLYSRKLDFGSGKVQPIRQVLDWRVAKAPSGREVTTWMRDAYTDHYFDSWGEWTHFSCSSSKSKTSTVIQVLIVELDLLKKTDLISKIMRGKMKSAIEENGRAYLDRSWNRIKSKY